MQRRDAVVAAVGAVILVVAIIGAAIDGPSQGDYRLTYATAETTTPLEGTGGATVTYDIEAPANLTAVQVEVVLSATSFPTGGSAHVTLTAPNGTKVEAVGAVAAAGTTFTVRAEAFAAPVPPERTVRAPTVEEASRALVTAPPAGNWTVEVRFSPSGPVPPQGVRIQATATLVTWTGSAMPEVSTSR